MRHWWVARQCVAVGIGVMGSASGAPLQTARQPPVLTSFAINEGAVLAPIHTPLRLTHVVVGTAPSAYRVSTRADFAGAGWLPYVRPLEVRPTDLTTTSGCEASGAARRLRLFLQVRSSLGDEVRIVNGQRTLTPVVAESNVMADSICVSGTMPE